MAHGLYVYAKAYRLITKRKDMMANDFRHVQADSHIGDIPDPLHGRKLRVGIISPYSFETPGGVQFHIRDFAQELIARGHQVEVLAPGCRRMARHSPFLTMVRYHG